MAINGLSAVGSFSTELISSAVAAVPTKAFLILATYERGGKA